MQQQSYNNNSSLKRSTTYSKNKLDGFLVKDKTIDIVEFIDLDDEHVILTVDKNGVVKRQWKQTGERLDILSPVFTVGFHMIGLGSHVLHYEVIGFRTGNGNQEWITTKCVETGAIEEYQAKNWSNNRNKINSDNNNSYDKGIRNFIEVVTGCKPKQGAKEQTKHIKYKSAKEVRNSIHIEPYTTKAITTKEVELPYNANYMPPSCYQVVQTEDRKYGLTSENITYSSLSGVYLWYSEFLRYIGESHDMVERGMSESTGECLDKFKDMSLEDILRELQNMLDNGNTGDMEVTHLINLYESYQVPLLYFIGQYGWKSRNKKNIDTHTHFESIFIRWNMILEERLEVIVINDKQRNEDIMQLLRTMPNTEFKLTDSVSELIAELVEPTQYEMEVIEEYCRVYGYKWYRLDSDHMKLIATVCRSLDMTVESLLFE